MITDAYAVDDGATLATDVCVVGAGPAGLALTLELTRRGREVLLLEAGGREQTPEGQSALQAANIGLPYFPLDQNRSLCLGGTSDRWAGWCRPLDPIDFEPRPWVPHSGWPLRRGDLEPYWARAHSFCEIEAADYSVSTWETRLETKRLALPAGEVETRMFLMSPPTRFGTRYGPELEAATSAKALLHAVVTGFESSEAGDRVTGVRVATPRGTAFRVRARRVVLAAGGIDNARLLLLPGPHHRDGIARGNDLVGRCFMEHLHFASGLIRLRPGQRPDLALYTRGSTATGRLFLPEAVQRRERLMNYNLMLEPTEIPLGRREALGRMLRRWVPGLPALWPHDPVRHLLRLPAGTRFLRLHHTLEQAPNLASRVTLDTQVDAFGRPRARLDWRLGSLEQEAMARSRDLVVRALRSLDLGAYALPATENDSEWPPQPVQGSRGHHMGTTRMGRTSREGVVDAECRVHGLANLYVVGSSVFPTSGCGTPTLNIVALAIRLAEHLAGAEAPGD